MKFVLAALFAVASAESPDCPESTQVFSYNERSPAATGFVQLHSACARSDIDGVRCLEDHKLFATGMNGDEDLGEDIQMKGEPFHFKQNLAQWNPLEVATPFADLPPCTGTNGPVFVNCKR